GYSSNPNAQVWTINLRQGVTFSDGTPFNATAVKDGMDNVFFANDVFVSYSTFIRDAPTFLASNQNAANRTIFQNSDGITILSTYSIQFNLSKPEADFISDLTGDYFAVSPSGIAANGGIQGHEVGNTWLYTHSDGTGEYILSSYSSVSNTEVYTANPNWWAISALNMKQPFYKVTINAVTNPTTEELDLRSGAADIIVLPASNVFDFANRTAWQTSGNLVSDVPQVSVWGPVAGAQNDFFALNSNIHTTGGSLANVQPFQNRHIIAALNDAWNASLFIQQDLNGFAIVNPGMMLQGQLGYQNFPSYYPYNLTTAKQNIIAACAQLGCTASNPLQITMTSENDQVSELAGSLLASNINSLQAGVVINFEPVATSAFLSSYIAKSYNIIILEYTGEPPDPLTYPLSMIGAGSAFQTGYSNSSVSALINQAAATPNVTQREQLYLQITEMIAQGGQFIKIGQPGAIFATSSRVGVLPYNSALLNTLPPIAALYPTK
ncbi:MAG: hypothetical protein JRN67_08045, partial [Nitrososphaerota archaeon]|nr:hypothetical protein [Nitrososphaerota archaeon]